MRHIGLGLDLEGGAISHNRVSQQLRRFFGAASDPKISKPDTQIGVSDCPILRQICLSPNFESEALSDDGLLKEFAPFFFATADPKFCKRDAQDVLNRGPILRRFSPCVERKCSLANLLCFLQLQVALCRFDRFSPLYKEPREGVSRIGPETSVTYNLAVFVLGFRETQLLLQQ